MGKQQSQPTVWRPAQAVVESPIITEGDIFAPLRRLRERYLLRAERIAARGKKHQEAEQLDRAAGCYKGAQFYVEAAARVGWLIPNRYEEAAVV